MITRQPANSMAFMFLTALVIFASYHPIFGLKGYESATLIVSLSLAYLLSSFISFRTQNTERHILSPISFFLILFLGWTVLGHFYTVDQDNSMTAIMRHLGGVTLLLGLMLNIKEEEDLQRFLWLALFCAGLMSVIAIVQQFEVFSAIIPKADKNMSTGFYGHRNVLATYLLLHFPLTIYFYFSSQTRNKKIIFGVLSILIVLALIFTRSRGGQLVLGIQLLGMLIYFVRKKDHAKMKDLIVGGVLTTVLYLGLFFLITGLVSAETELKKLALQSEAMEWQVCGLDKGERLCSAEEDRSKRVETPPSITNIFTGGYHAWDNLANRLVFWKTGWGIFKDYWLMGTGPWTFELLFPAYLAKETSGLVEGFTHFNPPHSHNIFIQIATETGLVGLGFFMVFLIAVYSRGIYLLRNAPSETRSFVFFLILSVTGFMIHNQIEYNWIQIHFIYPFIFLVFALDFLDKKYRPKKSLLKKTSALIYSSVLAGFVLVGIFSTVNYYKYQTLIHEKIIPGASVANIRVLTNEAKTYCPRCGWPRLEMAKNLISQYRLTPNPSILVSAETELKEVAVLTPFNFRQFVYLAEIRSFQKNWNGAKKLYDQAFKNIKMKQLHACRVISSNPDKC